MGNYDDTEVITRRRKTMFNFLILATFMALTSSVGAQCHCYYPNAEYPDKYVCDYPSFTEIPDCVPSNITGLEIVSPIPLNPETISRFTMLESLQVTFRDVDFISVDLFLYNTNILTFSLYKTNVEFIDKNIFRNTPDLYGLEMIESKFTSFPVDTFSYLPNLKFLYLGGNQLTTLSADHFQANSNLTVIGLDENPWQCDCQLATFIQWLMDRNIYVSGNATCKYPLQLQGLNLKNLKTENVC